MTENATFKVKTADERKAEYDAYYQALDEECKAHAYEIAQSIEGYMNLWPENTKWTCSVPDTCYGDVKTHLKTLYENAGFAIEFLENRVIIERK